MSSIEVITRDLEQHPRCLHGPTLLFCKDTSKGKREFFACSACRDRKHCQFFQWADQAIPSTKKNFWKQQLQNYTEKYSKLLSQEEIAKSSKLKDKVFCYDCSIVTLILNHKGHKIVEIDDFGFMYPSQVLRPLDDSKKEAQFLFSLKSVKTIIRILQNLHFKKVLNIGTPRLHEQVKPTLKSLLLDFDHRFASFNSKNEFCWYNLFNHYFFVEESKSVFESFLHADTNDVVLITDPPFGGRIEPIAYTLNKINSFYRKTNDINQDLSMMLIFPYFMEPQIANSLPNFHMLDLKIEYDNHPLFQNSKKGRKFGSPVRIFTNINPSSISLEGEEGYKYCKLCDKWVSQENKHCETCQSCTSKDGRTYEHCQKCERCVKPTWVHCSKCNRCTQKDHTCGQLLFLKECFHCKEPGHKKRDCPKVDHQQLFKKRKLKASKIVTKRTKINL